MFRAYEQTVVDLVDAYVLSHDIRPETAAWYRRTVSVLCRWHGGIVPVKAVDATLLNRFLLAKQEAGLSSHYRRSLRNGLRAVLGPLLAGEKLRSVRLAAVDPETWTPADVARLVEACQVLQARKATYWRLLVSVGWHTGLSQCDLHRLDARHISPDGTVRIRRAKTGAEVVAAVPLTLVGLLAPSGRLLPPYASRELLRRDFRKIVIAAGLAGTFKRLRASSGTQAELLTGRGHEHLANSRKVFEQHYLDPRRVSREPIRLDLPRIVSQPQAADLLPRIK